MGHPRPANAFCTATHGKVYAKRPTFSDDSHPGLLVTSSFPKEHRSSWEVKTGEPSPHSQSLTLFLSQPFKMGLVWDRCDCSRHPAATQCLCPQSGVYYLTGTTAAGSLIRAHSWCSVRGPWKTRPLLTGLQAAVGGVETGDYLFLCLLTWPEHPCLWPMLWNRDWLSSLFSGCFTHHW